jgi:DNA-binding IclR family transcriptional regulator
MTLTPTVPPSQWTFLTNHTHVLLCLVRRPDATLRQVALEVGITERAVQRIVRDLEQSGTLTRTRTGRRNSYAVNAAFALRHPLEAHRSVGDLLALLAPAPGEPHSE